MPSRRRPRFLRRVAAVLLLGSAAALASSSPASAALKLGVNDIRGWWIGSPNLPGNYPVAAHRNLAARDLTQMAASRLMYRAALRLEDIDPEADGIVNSWAFPDALYKTTVQRGVKVLPILIRNTTPTTATASVNIALVAKQIVARYKVGGPFWASNPTLPKTFPLDTLELWNEQNQSYYWAGTPQAYGLLLGRVWKAINEIAPGFKLVTGGLAETSTNGLTPGTWLGQALSVADGETGTVQTDPFFAVQGVALHPYGTPNWTANRVMINVNKFRTDLTAWSTPLGYPTIPPTWITEFGWRYALVSDPANNVWSENDILSRYQTVIGQLVGMGSAIGPIFAYNYRMGGTNTIDDGFGWNATVGTLTGGDTTQAHTGTQKSYGTWFSSQAATYTP